MKLYLYIRLSSADKDLKYKTESESIANQRELLHQYLKSHNEFSNYEVEEFIDDGYSGTNDNRPSFERMIEHLKNGDCKLVICKDFSRFFRDYVEIGDYLERIFPFLGVRFISVNDNYDSNDYIGTTGGLDVVMQSIVYSFYSKDLSQKIKTVMRAKAKKGQFIGSYPPYGYDKNPDNKNHLVIDENVAPVVRRIFEMAIDGKVVSEISVALNNEKIETPSQYFAKKYPDCKKFKKGVSKGNCWDSSNVRRILQYKIYTGAIVSQIRQWKGIDVVQTTMRDEDDWIVVPNCHEAIVSLDEFNEAQKAIRRVGKYERSNKDYLLRSLIRCGICGRVMTRNARGKVTTYYCDKSRFVEDTECPVGERFKESDLEKVILDNFLHFLTLLVDHEKKLKEAVVKTKGSESYLKKSVLKIEKSIKQNSQSKITAYERYSDGIISRNEFIEIREQLAMELEKFNEEKENLEKQLKDLENAVNPELKQLTSTAHEFLNAEQVTNQMLLYFIDRVYVYSGMRLEIQYKFKDTLKDVLEP